MRATRPAALPTRLERARWRFERWRRTRRQRRIPEALWSRAVKLAGEYGLHRTAQALRLNAEALKKRMQSAGRDGVAGGAVPARFVELVSSAPTKGPECLVELEDSRGAKLRIHFQGAPTADLAALGRELWSVRA